MKTSLVGVSTAVALFLMVVAPAQKAALAATPSSDTGAKKPARSGSTGAASDEVARLLDQHAAACAKSDADAVAALYADDAVFTSGRDRIDGRQAIRDYFAQVFQDNPNRVVTPLDRYLRVYNQGSGATAVVSLLNKNARTDPRGRRIVFFSREVLVFLKTHGRWSIVYHEAWPTMRVHRKPKRS